MTLETETSCNKKYTFPNSENEKDRNSINYKDCEAIIVRNPKGNQIMEYFRDFKNKKKYKNSLYVHLRINSYESGFKLLKKNATQKETVQYRILRNF